MTYRWMSPARIITLTDQVNSALAAAAYSRRESFAIDDPVIGPRLPVGYRTTPVARYRSYAQLVTDLNTGQLHKAYKILLYDPECWPDTPVTEQDNPIRYLREFCQLARRHDLRVISAPAIDLGLAQHPVDKRLPGESLATWYLRTQIPFNTAEHAYVYSIQSQSMIKDPQQFGAFISEAAFHGRNANPHALVLGGLSTMRGDAADNLSAARSIAGGKVDGWWLNADATTEGIGQVVTILQALNP